MAREQEGGVNPGAAADWRKCDMSAADISQVLEERRVANPNPTPNPNPKPSQEPTLFVGTVAENIQMGLPGATHSPSEELTLTLRG